jgi:hypothetical protein
VFKFSQAEFGGIGWGASLKEKNLPEQHKTAGLSLA